MTIELDKFVAVYRQIEPQRTLLDLNDKLDGCDILPGFELKVSALFD
jgi:hypothetical protein